MSDHSSITPQLRVVYTDQLLPHEDHDPQRLAPLVAQLARSSHLINPPIVGALEDANQTQKYVILDGANRWRAFCELGFPHILVQVIDLNSEQLRLETWNHVLVNCAETELIQKLKEIPQLAMAEGERAFALAHMVFRDAPILALSSPLQTTREHNATLRQIVHCFIAHATLFRTALLEPEDVWQQFPEAQAIIFYAHLNASDVQQAALRGAHLPPGVSRHIILGRAIRVNYPLQLLLDGGLTIEQKNANLQFWIQEKLKRRQLRFYAESTYIFDE
ncbi:MAG: ParB N-terminal domain-containing protein [Chloroflexi bacterium]|nr:ParB N-terminal domain-containing protein [Chloroflexota bacterium]